MGTLRAHGLAATLPAGFEGQIYQRSVTGGPVSMPVAQFATFALPAQTGDFGSGAVTLMGPNDVFAVLFEYGAESVGQPLFARQGMPRTLGVGDFRPFTLRRGLPGQSGTQWFFTEAGRAFTLYVVLGSHDARAQLVPMVNALLGSISISAGSGVGGGAAGAGATAPSATPAPSSG